MVQGFCPLKIEISQFPVGFRLKFKLQFKSTNFKHKQCEINQAT